MERTRPEWDEYFMEGAIWAATRSSCRHLYTGAVIVKNKRVIATGYNGAPPDIENCLKRGCRKEEIGVAFDDKGKGVCRGIHAEKNAMDQIAREDLKGTKIYTLYYPCSSCAKEIAGNGIIEVIYGLVYSEPDSLTKEVFDEKGIELRKMEINLEKYFEIMRNIMKPQ